MGQLERGGEWVVAGGMPPVVMGGALVVMGGALVVMGGAPVVVGGAANMCMHNTYSRLQYTHHTSLILGH